MIMLSGKETDVCPSCHKPIVLGDCDWASCDHCGWEGDHLKVKRGTDFAALDAEVAKYKQHRVDLGA